MLLTQELELSWPLDTAASRGNKGKNPILFSVCGRHLSPRLSEQKRANVLPSESLSSLCSKADLCFWVLRPRLWSQEAGARGRRGRKGCFKGRIGQGSPRSAPPSMFPGRAVGLAAASPELTGDPSLPGRSTEPGGEAGNGAVSASTQSVSGRPARRGRTLPAS